MSREHYPKIKKTQPPLSLKNWLLIIFVGLLLAGFTVWGVSFFTNEASVPAAVTDPMLTVESASFDPTVQLQDENASLSNWYIYGTHLSFQGSVTTDDLHDVQDVALILSDENGSCSLRYPLEYDLDGDTLAFSTEAAVNRGLPLEEISEGQYLLLLQVTIGDRQLQYPLYAKDMSALTYYTLTKNGANREIKLFCNKPDVAGVSSGLLQLACTACALPENVYDVVIDAGHGGTDSGAINGSYTEESLVLEIALRLEQKLEAGGLKVFLTRDGSESPDTMMAYTMYDEDGRVNTACASGAKLCLSLHLNSYEEYLGDGGLQIYCPTNADTSFASALAADIVKAADTYYSPMDSYLLSDGVYCRTFTPVDVSEMDTQAIEDHYTAYRIPLGTDYYYIIRELGGIATGAYVDGRNTKYGTNLYRNSRIGVESYLCELGYITLENDLTNLLENTDGYAEGAATAILNNYCS